MNIYINLASKKINIYLSKLLLLYSLTYIHWVECNNIFNTFQIIYSVFYVVGLLTFKLFSSINFVIFSFTTGSK